MKNPADRIAAITAIGRNGQEMIDLLLARTGRSEDRQMLLGLKALLATVADEGVSGLQEFARALEAAGAEAQAQSAGRDNAPAVRNAVPSITAEPLPGEPVGNVVTSLGLLCAAVCVFWASTSAIAAPTTCAEAKAALEKRLQARGAALPALQIVPRSLAGGNRVVGTCENGTQKIVVQRIVAAPPAAASQGESGRGGSM